MGEHYTRSTVEVEAWCKKHGRRTPHTVSDRRLGHCIPCFQANEQAINLAHGHSSPTIAVKATFTTPLTYLVEIPCKCKMYAFPHYHSDGKRRSDRL